MQTIDLHLLNAFESHRLKRLMLRMPCKNAVSDKSVLLAELSVEFHTLLVLT